MKNSSFSVKLKDNSYVVKEISSFTDVGEADYIIANATCQKSLTGLIINGLRYEPKTVKMITHRFDLGNYDYVPLDEIPITLRATIPDQCISLIKKSIFSKSKIAGVKAGLKLWVPCQFPERHQFSHYSLITKQIKKDDA